MGNHSSSVQPAGPPPLLSAAVIGDVKKFDELWTGEDSTYVQDRQENNVLHALFSCRNAENDDCSEILKRIHNSLSRSRLQDLYRARNTIGCTPLWILVAYGNVKLLKEVRQKFAGDDQADAFLEIIRQPNKQGDSPLLATCSQGNTDMLCFLKEELLSLDQFNLAITASNKNGTTPLQIIVGNNHLSLLKYVLEEGAAILQSQFLESNKAGISLFHICSERNAHEILSTILTFMIEKDDVEGDIVVLDQILSLQDKNGANALHVATFCGNKEVVRVWVDAISRTHSDSKSRVAMLDKLDGQARSAYWLGMVKGHDEIGKIFADEGVNTSNAKMVKEIQEACERRAKAAAARQKPNQTIDGSALINR